MKPFIAIILFSYILVACGTSDTAEVTVAENETKTNTPKPVRDNNTPEATPVKEIKEVDGVIPNKSGRYSNQVQRIGFYNLENLFDTNDDAKKKDEEFLPTAEGKWDKEKYQEKIAHLAKVMDYMGQPGIMGVCEIENVAAIKDLVKADALKAAKYKYVHQESPDIRGIDVALLYSSDEYELVKKDFIRINFPKSIIENYTTRDVLYATLKNKKNEYIHVFVCHWPSRRGGVTESEPKRLYVAKQVRKKINDIFSEYDNNHVIVMGDLNDGPDNKSVNEVLGAVAIPDQPKSEKLYHALHHLYEKGYGSHNYRGEWNMLDHIVVSGSLLDDKGTDINDAEVFNRDWMLYYHKKSGQYRPNRTYSGGKYYGGYSDHLPVCAEIK